MDEEQNNQEAVKQAEQLQNIEQDKKTQEITTEQVLQASLGFYLPEIMKAARGNNPIPDSENVFKITYESGKTEKELPAYTNILTKKQKSVDLCDLDIFKNMKDNSLFLNQAVPYVKIYKTIKNDKGEFIDINLPFDVVTGQEYKEANSLQQRILNGGSGGTVGIVDFSWKSEGKNEGNISLYAVNFKIFMQDIKELKRIRNQVGENSVAILDLLYYGFIQDPNKQENTTSNSPTPTDEYEPGYLEFKAEVGFNLPSYYQQYEEYFKTTLNLTVHRHNFTFKESGMVELDITAIGNIENSYSNKVNYNILESENIKLLNKTIKDIQHIKTIQTVKRRKELLGKYANSEAYKIAETIEETSIEWEDVVRFFFGRETDRDIISFFSEELAKLTEKESDLEKSNQVLDIYIKILKRAKKSLKVNIINKIFENLKKQNKVKYFILQKSQFETLKYFISYGDNLLSSELEKIQQSVTNLSSSPSIQEVESSEGLLRSEIRGDIITFSADALLGNYNINLTDSVKEIRQKNPGSEIVSFIFLGDLLQSFISNDPILKQEMNIFLSPFSYYNYSKTLQRISSSPDTEKKKIKERKSNNGENSKKTYIYNVDKEIGDLYYVPISVTTIQKFFKDKIESMEEETYSFNNFLKFCMSDLIRENISTKSSPGSPQNIVKINPYYFSADDENLPFVSTKRINIKELAEFYNSRMQTNQEFKKHKKNIAFISVGETSIEDGSFTGNKLIDCKNNILHLPVNSMYSFVKQITFSRDDDARLEAANLHARTDAHQNEIIRQVYQANVNMFGNVFFEPGNLVFLQPNYPGTDLDMNILYQIGLGGYYRIIEINNQLSVGGFSTTMKCMWEMSKDGTENVAGAASAGTLSIQQVE
jgi:hypothetical protein